MKTILITGGASGLGKGIALNMLKKGNRVIVLGSSPANGEIFYKEAKQLGAKERALFMQADLTLVTENERVVEHIKEQFTTIDVLIFCATKHNRIYTETKEGFESSFALDYLSRFILSYGLKEILETSSEPMILNVGGTGMNGNVDWDDLQHKEHYEPQKVMMHGSRLNDLSGVEFAKRDTSKKIKYILYNPWAVQTSGMKNFYKSPFMWQLYKWIGKSVDKAADIVSELLEHPPKSQLSAYRERKILSMEKKTYEKSNADRLYDMTVRLLKDSELRILN